MKEKYLKFLESVKTTENESLVEAIIEGFTNCFEANVEFTAKDINTGISKNYLMDHIPLRDVLDKNEALKQVFEKIIHEWFKISENDIKNAMEFIKTKNITKLENMPLYLKRLLFVVSNNPVVTLDSKTSYNLTGLPQWERIRNIARNLYSEEINELERLILSEDKTKIKMNRIPKATEVEVKNKTNKVEEYLKNKMKEGANQLSPQEIQKAELDKKLEAFLASQK